MWRRNFLDGMACHVHVGTRIESTRRDGDGGRNGVGGKDDEVRMAGKR